MLWPCRVVRKCLSEEKALDGGAKAGGASHGGIGGKHVLGGGWECAGCVQAKSRKPVLSV